MVEQMLNGTWICDSFGYDCGDPLIGELHLFTNFDLSGQQAVFVWFLSYNSMYTSPSVETSTFLSYNSKYPSPFTESCTDSMQKGFFFF